MRKNIFAFVIAASLGLGLVSCEDFIEHEKRGVQDLDNYFETDTECRDFVIDLYKRALLNNDWQPIAHTRITNETATDDAWMGNTGQATDGFSPASEYLITPNRMGYLTDLFKERYKNIMSCNIAINSIPEAPISEDKKKAYVGEALFCRAYNYLDLVGNFGGVPLVLKMLSSNDMNLGRSSKEEIYQQIESDLKSAVHMVNTTYGSEGKGRATVWTCTALLARVSLYQGKWEEAYHYADTTIVNSGCKLEPDFLDIWNVNNHNGIESLIEVQTSSEIGKILGLDRDYHVIILGAGNLGHALANYAGFEKRGFVVSAVFDVSPDKIGKKIGHTMVYDMKDLEGYVKGHTVDIAALTLPKSIAPAVAKQLVQYGVSAFWNFAATDLNLPGNIAVENVHLAESLMRLSYNISNLPE